MFLYFLLIRLSALMLRQVAKLHLKFVYLAKLLSNCEATVSLEYLEIQATLRAGA